MKRKQKQPSLVPFLLIGGGGLLLLIAAVWLAWPSNSPAAEQPAAVQNIPYPEIDRVSVKDAYAAQLAGTAILLDVRGEPYYSEGHAAGAVSISVDELPARLAELNPEEWIIPYCT